jgi:hypothetical protein
MTGGAFLGKQNELPCNLERAVGIVSLPSGVAINDMPKSSER